VLTRLIERGRDESGIKVVPFFSHNRRAKRRILDIMNAKGEKPRIAADVNLLKITGKVLSYARNCAKRIKNSIVAPSCVAMLAGIAHQGQYTEKVYVLVAIIKKRTKIELSLYTILQILTRVRQS
jgi:hypothetical protein